MFASMMNKHTWFERFISTLLIIAMSASFLVLGLSCQIGVRSAFSEETWKGPEAYMIRASVNSSGDQGNRESYQSPSISSDGRYVAFQSYASNLVSGDTNNIADVFRKDLSTGYVVRASVGALGEQAMNGGGNPSISSDGRYVAFTSMNSNFVGGNTYENIDEVFRKDLQTGQIIRVTSNSSGKQANNYSYSPVISSDGRYVVFASDASNLVSSDTNGKTDIFMKDIQTGQTIRVSSSASGNQANGYSESPSISSDGRYVAFSSQATNLVSGDTNNKMDIFRKDLQTGEIIRVSTDSTGKQLSVDSNCTSINSDGRYIAFVSFLSMLRKDLQTGKLVKVSTSPAGEQADYSSYYPSISSDGRYVAFVSYATNLDFTDTNGKADVFRKDLLNGGIIRVSVDASGKQANDEWIEGPSISSNGRFIAFISKATNLIIGDTNGKLDIFLADLSLYPDKIPPLIPSDSVPTYSTNVSSTVGFSIGWAGTDNVDGYSGIAGYQLQYRNHTTTAWATLKVDGNEWTTKKSRGFVGKPGYTYYFKVRAKDKAGNISSWMQKHTIVPYDDTALTYSSNWHDANTANDYKNTLKYSSKKDEYATLAFTGKSVTLIAPKGPYKGRVDVYIRDKINGVWQNYNKVKTIDLYSETYKNRVPFTIKSWYNSSTHQIKFVVAGTKSSLSKGYRTDIDGVGVLK